MNGWPLGPDGKCRICGLGYAPEESEDVKLHAKSIGQFSEAAYPLRSATFSKLGVGRPCMVIPYRTHSTPRHSARANWASKRLSSLGGAARGLTDCATQILNPLCRPILLSLTPRPNKTQIKYARPPKAFGGGKVCRVGTGMNQRGQLNQKNHYETF